MFSPFMDNTWWAATVIAVVAGAIGFFVVARGLAFAAHALPNGAFAGAAGATLIGASTLLGLGVFSVGGAFAIGALGRRARHDVATALTIVTMLGLGALFLTVRPVYAPAVYALLFGQLFGVSNDSLLACFVLGAVCLLVLAVLYRPLLLSSITSEVGAARGLRPQVIDTAFLLLIALVTTTAVPVVGALLVFSLLIAPAATARRLADRPGTALLAGVGIALAVMWGSVALSYETNLPMGFLVGGGGAVLYAVAAAVGRG